MAVKRKSLSAALEPREETKQVKSIGQKNPIKSATKPTTRQSDRVGKKNISAWFPLAVSLELEELRIERSRSLGRKLTMQELLGEAYNDLFKKYGRPELIPTAEDTAH